MRAALTDHFDHAFDQPQPATSGEPPIWSFIGDWQEADIPPRPWVIDGYFMRGAVTVIAGPGSAGKSSLVCLWAVAACLGREVGRFAPPEPLRVMLYNVEDDLHEQQRRLSAALRYFDATPRDLGNRLAIIGPTSVPTLIDRDPLTGVIHETPAWAKVNEAVDSFKPDLAIFDPLVELHSADENDNVAMRSVMAPFRVLAQHKKIPTGLVAHTRKGGTAGDIDSMRGAGSQKDLARIGITVFPMSKEEAEELNIPSEQRRRYLRVDSPKMNYAPSAEADWHNLNPVQLDNGEWVARAEPWTPPMPAVLTPDVRDKLERIAAEGFAPGVPWSAKLDEEDRSIRAAMARLGISSAAAEKAALGALWEAGFRKTAFRHPVLRKVRMGIQSPQLTPKAEWV